MLQMDKRQIQPCQMWRRLPATRRIRRRRSIQTSHQNQVRSRSVTAHADHRYYHVIRVFLWFLFAFEVDEWHIMDCETSLRLVTYLTMITFIMCRYVSYLRLSAQIVKKSLPDRDQVINRSISNHDQVMSRSNQRGNFLYMTSCDLIVITS